MKSSASRCAQRRSGILSMASETDTRVTNRAAEFFFYLEEVVCLPLGMIMYVIPETTTAFWPYAIKPLASRMFGSMFLALAIAAILALRDRRGISNSAVLVTTWPIFLTVAIAGTIAPGLQPSLGSWLLSAFLLAMALTGFLLFVRRTGKATGPLDRIPRGLRRAFLGHAVIVTFFGLNMFFLPSLAFSFWPWRVSSTVMRGLGGLFLGTAAGTAWACAQKYRENVMALLLPYFAFVGLVLLDVASSWGVILAESPGAQVTLFWILVYAYVAAYTAYFSVRQRSWPVSVREGGKVKPLTSWQKGS